MTTKAPCTCGRAEQVEAIGANLAADLDELRARMDELERADPLEERLTKLETWRAVTDARLEEGCGQFSAIVDTLTAVEARIREACRQEADLSARVLLIESTLEQLREAADREAAWHEAGSVWDILRAITAPDEATNEPVAQRKPRKPRVARERLPEDPREAARALAARYPSLTANAIAKRLRASPSTVRNWLKPAAPPAQPHGADAPP